MTTSPSEQEKKVPQWIEFDGKPYFVLNEEETKYLVDNIQHEYLNKDTYYFASDLFGRMQRFLDGLANRNSQTT